MKSLKILNRARNQDAFTIIEVLIALVYMTIGLLGIVAMEDVALSRNVDARRLTIATNLATEMIERIRMNSPANINPLLAAPFAPPYLYNGITACAAVAPANCAGQIFPANAGNTAPNGPASGDYGQWTGHFAVTDGNGQALLPNGVGRVTSTVVGAPALGQVQIDVRVQWSTGLRAPAITLSTIVAPL
jgi:type IV pilus modification protein PilV